MKIKLTRSGYDLLKKVIAGESNIIFSKLQIGNSTEWSEGSEFEATELKNPLLTANFIEAAISGDYIKLKTQFDNKSFDSGFHITEIGYFAKYTENGEERECLYGIGIVKEDVADYVPGIKERPFEVEFEGLVFIGESENVTAVINDSLTYVNIKDFNDHVNNYENPHKVTKGAIGLGEVPNVSTNDQLPTFSESDTFLNLESGKDKLSILFGKIKKAISVLKDHIVNEDNPHKLRPESIKAAPIIHKHSATDIEKGELSVLRGGTGNKSFSENSVLLGNEKESFKSVKGEGAFFCDGFEAPKFDYLPAKYGGVTAEIKKEDGYSCYGAAKIGKDILIQWGRLRIEKNHKTKQIDFKQAFKNKDYVVIFTTSAGSPGSTANQPDWNVPKKYESCFVIGTNWNDLGFDQVADWIAIGEPAD